LGTRRPAAAAGLRLEVQRAELIETDHDRRTGFGGRVERDDAVALDFEVGIGGALPRPHRLKADALGLQQLPQPLVGDVRDHPLGDQVVGQLGQRPRRERLVEIQRIAERNALDFLTLGQRKVCGRPPV
jgi:hypothetical protein